MLQPFIPQLMQDLGIDNTILGSDMASGTHTLRLEGNLKIVMKDISDGCTLSCVFAPYSKGGNEEALTTRMMMANLFGQGTRNAILGLTDDGANLILNRPIDYPITYKEFKEAIEDLINTIDFWIAELPQAEKK